MKKFIIISLGAFLVVALVVYKFLNPDRQAVAEIEASQFILNVKSDKYVRIGESLKVEATMKYNGSKVVNLTYGDPIIRINIIDSSGKFLKEGIYNDIAKSTSIKPGDSFEKKEEFRISKAGEYTVLFETSMLKVDGNFIIGVGNDQYIKSLKQGNGSLNEQLLKAINSQITMAPIKIRVK